MHLWPWLILGGLTSTSWAARTSPRESATWWWIHWRRRCQAESPTAPEHESATRHPSLAAPPFEHFVSVTLLVHRCQWLESWTTRYNEFDMSLDLFSLSRIISRVSHPLSPGRPVISPICLLIDFCSCPSSSWFSISWSLHLDFTKNTRAASLPLEYAHTWLKFMYFYFI